MDFSQQRKPGLFGEEMHEALQVYGNEVNSPEEAQLIVLTLHDGDWLPGDLLSRLHKFSGFSDYQAVERDFGTFEVAGTIMQKITGTLWLNVRLPRCVIDLNRIGASGVPLKLPAEDDALSQQLLELHSKVEKNIRYVLAHTPNAHAVFDIHSMCPGDPDEEEVPQRWDSLQRYVEKWKHAAQTGARRKIDLTDERNDGSPAGDRLLSQMLAKVFSKKISKKKWRWAFNQPYSKIRQMPIDFVYRPPDKSGISIDFPKDLICSSPGTTFDLTKCSANTEEIGTLAEDLKPILECYRTVCELRFLDPD